MTEYYIVKNWERFQHYKDRNPPWIKLHFELLSSEAWVLADDATRNLMIVCMLIASRNDGKVPANANYVRRVGYLKREPKFKSLVELGFLEKPLADASALQADARPETETYRTDREETEATLSSVAARAPDPPNQTDFEKIYQAGSAVFPNLATANTASIHSWIAAGCVAERDVIPEIQRHAKAGKPVASWKYFTGGIMEAKAAHSTPLPEGNPNGATRTYQNSPAKSKHDIGLEGIARARAKRLAAEQGQA